MIITVDKATVRTATVEIKALMISGRQVTLAVFRQLEQENLVGIDGSPKGTPWGYVNYHTAGAEVCRFNRRHRHIVWQKGDELRADILEAAADAFSGLTQAESQELAGYDNIAFLQTVLADLLAASPFDRRISYQRKIRAEIILGDDLLRYVEGDVFGDWYRIKAGIAELIAEYTRDTYTKYGVSGVEESGQRQQDYANRQRFRKASYKRTLDELFQLPQLFIAV